MAQGPSAWPKGGPPDLKIEEITEIKINFYKYIDVWGDLRAEPQIKMLPGNQNKVGINVFKN